MLRDMTSLLQLGHSPIMRELDGVVVVALHIIDIKKSWRDQSGC
jgi:hypothetical protein